MNLQEKVKYSIFIFASIFLATSCTVSTTSDVPDDVRIERVDETRSNTPEIILTRLFDHCESGGGLTKNMTLGQMATDSTTKEFTLGAAGGAEFYISPIAQGAVLVELERKWGSRKDIAALFEEEIEVNVPPYTKQQLTVVLQETIIEGVVYYWENDELERAEYSYRTNLSMVSEKMEDVPCEGEETTAQVVIAPSPTVVPTVGSIAAVSTESSTPTGVPTEPAPVSLWNEQSAGVPNSGTQLVRSLSAGERLYLTGGSFVLGSSYCGEDEFQICIVIYEATTPQDVVIDALVPSNNYLATTNFFTYDDLVNMHIDAFWQAPNCGGGCSKASIYHYLDGQLQGQPLVVTAP